MSVVCLGQDSFILCELSLLFSFCPLQPFNNVVGFKFKYRILLDSTRKKNTSNWKNSVKYTWVLSIHYTSCFKCWFSFKNYSFNCSHKLYISCVRSCWTIQNWETIRRQMAFRISKSYIFLTGAYSNFQFPITNTYYLSGCIFFFKLLGIVTMQIIFKCNFFLWFNYYDYFNCTCLKL